MDPYDPQQPDSYAHHLAQLDTPRGAVAARDIYNRDGVLLVKKGYAIKTETVQRLINHRLVQPLETSVNVADAISGQQLFEDVLAMLRADKECQAIHQALQLDDPLREQCQLYASFALVTQKTTVLHSRFREQYTRALFSAWFALAVTVQTQSKEALGAAFIAGLVHDMGLLHIDPEVVAKTQGHSEEDLRALKSHTLIADAFLAYVEGLPQEVRRAVREHHEHNDGSGYPLGLFTEKLSDLGRVIALADSVWLASKSPSGRKVHTLAEVVTLAKMSAVQQSSTLLSALYQMQQKAKLSAPAARSPEQLAMAVSHMVAVEQSLRSQFVAIKQLLPALPNDQHDRLLRSIHLKVERLWLIVTASGLLSDTLCSWLQEVASKDDASAALDIHDMSLMYTELQWQLAQLGQTLQLAQTRSTTLNDQAQKAIGHALTVLTCGSADRQWHAESWRSSARA